MADKQDLCHRVKAEKEVVGLPVPLFVPFQQINLEIDMIRGLIDATLTFSIGLRFSFMNILHVESDSLA